MGPRGDLSRWPLAQVCAELGLVPDRWVELEWDGEYAHVAGCSSGSRRHGGGDLVPLVESHSFAMWCGCVHAAWGPDELEALSGDEVVLGVYGPQFAVLRRCAGPVAYAAVLGALTGLVESGRRWWARGELLDALAQWCHLELASAAQPVVSQLEAWLQGPRPEGAPPPVAGLGSAAWQQYTDQLARRADVAVEERGDHDRAAHWVVCDGPVLDGVLAAWLAGTGSDLSDERVVVQLPAHLAEVAARRPRRAGGRGGVWDLGPVSAGDHDGVAETLAGLGGVRPADLLEVARAVWAPPTRHLR